MIFGLLFRKEVLLLAGITAAFAVPMFRSGELSVGKILHWAANGIAPQEPEAPKSDPNFGVWTPNGSQAPSTNLVPQGPAPDTKFNLAGLLGSIFEVQTVSEPTITTDPTNSLVATSKPGLGAAASAQPPSASPTSVGIPDATVTSTPGNSRSANREPLPVWIPVNDLREIIRFDVSPYWVQQRWQPSTRLDLDQDGYYGFRVPLMTDEKVGQLNGALTYYFDGEGVVQRIQFRGTAAETAPLHNLLTQYFRFQAVPDREKILAPIHQNAARGLFRFTDPVVEIAGQNRRLCEVAFEINSTQGRYQLSEAYRQLAIQ
ncbi:MAG: hypothetical protein JNL67_23055 [Planctomycetaceae bacterium]|nr:hypothetical protein [Planctomycetaceae bacterium]